MGDSGRLTKYTGTPVMRLWCVEDSEKHWYICEHAHEALKAHVLDYDSGEALEHPGEGVSVVLLAGNESFTVTMDDQGEGLPEHWPRGPRPNDITAFAAEWAEYYRQSALKGFPCQIASTVI